MTFDILLEKIESGEELSREDFKGCENLAKNGDTESKNMLAIDLAMVVPELAEPILLLLLNDEDMLVRANACDSLSESHSKDVMELLKKKLSNEPFLVRGYAISSISDIAINTRSEVETLIQLFEKKIISEKNVWVCLHYYQALYKLGKTEYLKLLLNGLQNKYYRNRCLTAHLLLEILNKSNEIEVKHCAQQRFEIEKSLAVKGTLCAILSQKLK